MSFCQMAGFNSQLMEKEEATRSIEQKLKDAKVCDSVILLLFSSYMIIFC